MMAGGAGWALTQEQDSEPAGYSHARVVRLSFVEGSVTVQRPDMTDWAEAPANTPIQEGFKLSTAADGFAEVEFENADSTLRLGQHSMLEFTQLALARDGGKVNHLVLDQGYATFHFVPADNDDYQVTAAETTVKPQGKAEFRIDLDQGRLRVEVFKGSLEATGPGGDTTLAKDGVLVLAPGESYQLSQGITKDDWDEWVAQRDQAQAAAGAPASSGAYSAENGGNYYGWSDLSYYGDWGYLPNYGNVWFPPVGAGWSPYSTGRWCWYPGFGYTWIDFEPWGWMPFHYGGWFFDSALGWFWTPLGFGEWSPALVTWYQGPGWVGWAPRPTRLPRHIPHSAPSAGTQPCAGGRTCMTAVSLDVLREGKAIAPQSLMAVDLAGSRGRAVSGPELTPTRLASLPGTPATEAALRHGPAGGEAAPGSFRVSDRGSAFVEKAPSSLGLGGAEKASGGFFGARTGPARESSGSVRPGDTRTGRGWGAGSLGHFGGWHAAPRESSGASTGNHSGGSSGGGHASSGGGSSSGGHSGGGGGSSGGGGGHSGGGSSGGSHH